MSQTLTGSRAGVDGFHTLWRVVGGTLTAADLCAVVRRAETPSGSERRRTCQWNSWQTYRKRYKILM